MPYAKAKGSVGQKPTQKRAGFWPFLDYKIRDCEAVEVKNASKARFLAFLPKIGP